MIPSIYNLSWIIEKYIFTSLESHVVWFNWAKSYYYTPN